MTLLPLSFPAPPPTTLPLVLPPAPTAVPIQTGFGALFAALVGGGTPSPVPAPVLTVVSPAPVEELAAPEDDQPQKQPEDLPEEGTPVIAPALAAQLALAPIVVRTTPGPAPDLPAPEPEHLALIPVAQPDAPAPAPSAPTAPSTAPLTAPLTPPTTQVPVVTMATVPATAPVTPLPDPGPTTPVTRQVFPEVTRLVSAGNGTHRVTLQLSPEALGDVRVVLTVRDGAVHVRLAAGDDAQHALREGAPELRRLLEAAGAADTRIVVRDLASAPGTTTPPSTGTPTASTQTPTGDGARGGGPAYDGGRGGPDQHAGTRGGGSTARDGTHDGTTRPRHVDQVARARTTGLDVTV